MHWLHTSRHPPSRAHLRGAAHADANLGRLRLCRPHRLLLALAAPPQVHCWQRRGAAGRGRREVGGARHGSPRVPPRRGVVGRGARLAEYQPVRGGVVRKHRAGRRLAAARQAQLHLHLRAHRIVRHGVRRPAQHGAAEKRRRRRGGERQRAVAACRRIALDRRDAGPLTVLLRADGGAGPASEASQAWATAGTG